MKNEKHTYSIRTKLTCITIIVITSVVLLCWILNKTFLSKFYEERKMDLLGSTYDYINNVFMNYDGSELDYDQATQIERICSVSNVNVYVYDFNSNIISLNDKTGINYIYPDYVSKPERDEIFSKLIKYLPDNLISLDIIGGSESKLNGVSESSQDDEISLLDKNDKYIISKVLDTKIHSYVIELQGNLDNGLYVYISSNFDSIKESVDISNRFLAYIGIGAVFVGFIIMFFVSRSFSSPILELAAIAKRMSDLDFDARYEVRTQDEIAQLGENMNFLSDKLKETITELKNANNELEKDIKKKIQIDEMRKEFLSNVSHELKTPIALIQGYAEGLKDNINEDQESRDFYLDVIIDEANKMNNMVKKLLDLNNIEFGESNMNIERFNITQVISGVLESTKILAEQKDAKIVFTYNNPLFVWADEYMIEEVITNYISNAFNHLDGERVIKISIKRMDDRARISVFNTGKTIPEDELDKIWIKFYKVDKARTREYGGSGVGLSIVKAIMNSHNREFGVINHKNGVEFWFELDTSNLSKEK